VQTEIKLSTSSVFILLKKNYFLPICRHLVVSEAIQSFQIGSAKTFDDSTDPDC
jgi:hypothetical protein